MVEIAELLTEYVPTEVEDWVAEYLEHDEWKYVQAEVSRQILKMATKEINLWNAYFHVFALVCLLPSVTNGTMLKLCQ